MSSPEGRGTCGDSCYYLPTSTEPHSAAENREGFLFRIRAGGGRDLF